jgi:hypothetical protein
MKELEEKLSKNEMINYYINNDVQFKSLSYEFSKNYHLLLNMIEIYEEELAKVLILSRPTDMHAFFRDQNTVLKNMYQIFSKVKNEKVKLLIENKIDNQRKLNIRYAKHYMQKIEKTNVWL